MFAAMLADSIVSKCVQSAVCGGTLHECALHTANALADAVSSGQPDQQSDQMPLRSMQVRGPQQSRHPKTQVSEGGSSLCSTDGVQHLTMLRSPAAVLPSRHLSQNASCQVQ